MFDLCVDRADRVDRCVRMGGAEVRLFFIYFFHQVVSLAAFFLVLLDEASVAVEADASRSKFGCHRPRL
jgi:hypothetical protein